MASNRPTMWLCVAILHIGLLSAADSSPVRPQPVTIQSANHHKPKIANTAALSAQASALKPTESHGKSNQAIARTQGKRQADNGGLSRRNEDPWFLDQAPFPLQPYKFDYDIKDPNGLSQQYRREVGDGQYLTGSYGYILPDGIYRHVDYVADDRGFRALIRTSEPGTSNQNPASVVINANPPLYATPNIQFTKASDPLSLHAPDYSTLNRDIELTRQRQAILYGQTDRVNLDNTSFSNLNRPRSPQKTSPSVEAVPRNKENLVPSFGPARSSSTFSNAGSFGLDQSDPSDFQRIPTGRPILNQNKESRLNRSDTVLPPTLDPWTQRFSQSNFQPSRVSDPPTVSFGHSSSFETYPRQSPVNSVDFPFNPITRLSLLANAGPRVSSSAYPMQYDRLIVNQGSGGPQESRISYNNKHLFHETPLLALERSRGIAQLNQLNLATRGLNYIRPLLSATDDGTLNEPPSLNDAKRDLLITSGRGDRIDENRLSEMSANLNDSTITSKFNSSTIKVSTEFEVSHNENQADNSGRLPPPEPAFLPATKTSQRPILSKVNQENFFGGIQGPNSRLRAPYTQFAQLKGSSLRSDRPDVQGDDLRAQFALKSSEMLNQNIHSDRPYQALSESSTIPAPTSTSTTTQSPGMQPEDADSMDPSKSRELEPKQPLRTPTTKTSPENGRSDSPIGADNRPSSDLMKRSYHRGSWAFSSRDTRTLLPMGGVGTSDAENSLMAHKSDTNDSMDSLNDIFESQRLAGETKLRASLQVSDLLDGLKEQRDSKNTTSSGELNAGVSYDEEPAMGVAKPRQTFNFLDTTYQQYQRPKRERNTELFQYDNLVSDQQVAPPIVSTDSQVGSKAAIGFSKSVKIQLNEAADSLHGSVIEIPKQTRRVAKIERSSFTDDSLAYQDGFAVGKLPQEKRAAPRGFYEVLARGQ